MEELSGVIKTIVYRNRDSGWTVLELTVENGDVQSVVGVLPQLSPGEQARLVGAHTVHPKYGPQFRAQSCEVLAPSSVTAVEQYLSSGLIKGIGPATAKSIVLRFGMDAISVLENQPERLREIGGIGAVRAKTIADSFREQRDSRESMLALQTYGLTVKQAMALMRIFGDAAVSEIERDPYAALLTVDGIGFRTADAIAMRSGVEPDSAARMEAGILYVLQWARQEGHTCLPREKTVQVAAENVLFTEPGPIERALDELILSGKLIYQLLGEVDMVFLPALYHLEVNAAKQLLSLAQPPADDPMLNIPAAIAALEHELHTDLAPLQKQAVLSALTEGAMVITGGPGTGKTTILRFIIRIMERLSLDFALCAPTGRAAKRMSEATGAEALTIHRLLECGMDGNGETRFNRNADNPLFYDMIVVDEMSMVDAPLFAALLSALPEGTRLVMVGDADQLPPVGAGNVLLDVINSDTLPVIRLTEIFRQAERSSIVLNAHRINSGSERILSDEQQDFRFEAAATEKDALERLLQLLQNTDSPLLSSDPL
ncbi:MAG: AAA family ATPase, partial [Eubacteriales bacterium]|nr:AAA family ATPase [Eubacteriales bacterium]